MRQYLCKRGKHGSAMPLKRLPTPEELKIYESQGFCLCRRGKKFKRTFSNELGSYAVEYQVLIDNIGTHVGITKTEWD